MTNYIQQIKNVYFLLETSIHTSEDKMKSEQKIYSDLYRIFSKNGTKLAALANTINEQVQSSSSQEELINHYHQMLSNSLLRLADCSRRVAMRFKSEVVDPLKTFNENCVNIFEDIKKKIDDRIESIVTHHQEHGKAKDIYSQAYQKFEKHREMQKKVMQKIENGNKNELEKFNINTKKLTENIAVAEKGYASSVEKINNEWEVLRKDFTLHYQSIIYNENTKLLFFKKTVVNSIKIFEELRNSSDPELLKKIEEASNSDRYKNENPGFKQLKTLLDKVIKNEYMQQFINYEDTMRSKKRRMIEEEGHLAELFSQLKQTEKRLITDLVSPWFVKASKKFNEVISPIKETSQKLAIHSSSHDNANQKLSEKEIAEIDQCKEKIISQSTHSFYFIEFLYYNITNMTSFYCKVSEDYFLYILNAFTVITNNIDQNTDIGIEFIYKMMIVAQRISLKKTHTKASHHSKELLCQRFGKTTVKFRDNKLITKLLAFIEKQKSSKKNNENKGTFNRAKGFFAAFTRKNQVLSEQQLYNCLEELIKIIANFSIPNDIALPFIKQALGNSHQNSYEYLKGIILHKKDVEERQSLFYKKEIKEKKEELFKKAVENKKMGEYALKIIAQHGFFGQEELSYRTICRNLRDIHLQILGRLKMVTETKWIRLIPVNWKMQYIQMKQQVAQQSVPSAVEEIITLDVNRSLHLHGETLNPTVLHSLLRIYAYFHKDISYCQGMNYLAGYIYIKTLNEQSTYRIFEYLMQVRFKEIFVNEFEVLRIKMYQFERLLSIFHPEISEHFKRQSISPQCYIVSWIITLFASSYQYTLSSFLIDFLWERFIIWGWPEFFRFVLWLFSIFKEDLIELTYDRALHFLGQLSRSDMFLADESKFRSKYGSIEDPKVGIQRYPVSEDLLSKFKEEYVLDK